MYFEESEISKARRLPIINGYCKDCEFWDEKEFKPNFRACKLKIIKGKVTMVCRRDDVCKSFKQKNK